MPVYAEGIRHERNCPVGEAEEAAAAAAEAGAADSVSDLVGDSSEGETTDTEQPYGRHRRRRGAQKLCSEKRCCTWFDLSNWFGFLPLQLSQADFQACFTDVANGGPGLYEKLVVLGGKTLDIVSEMHFYEMYPEASKAFGMPQDMRVEPEALRVLWARRRTERVCSLAALFLFGKSYLAAAQSLPTRLAVAKYVKACVGFCCRSPDTENLYKWMPVLVEHIFWTQRLRTERLHEDNALLQDLQELFGYKFDHLLPRIRECLEGVAVPQRSDSPTGRELLKLYATDYFTKLSEEAGVEPSRRVVWVEQEVEHFLGGPAVAVFAVACMSLGPYVMALKEEGPTRAQHFVDMFEALLAACWVISTEEKVKIWMPSLIQRLRQTQLVLHMAQMGDKYFANKTRLQKPAKTPIEARQVAASNNGFLDPFALWNVDPMRRPVAEAPVEYPGPPLYYGPPARGSTLDSVSCPPCCFLSAPHPAPRIVPGRPSKKTVTLFDSEENRYELYPLGPQVFPLHRRRPNAHMLSNNSARDGRSLRSCCSGSHPPAAAGCSGGAQDKWAPVAQRAVDVSIQTPSQQRPAATERHEALAGTWSGDSGRPSVGPPTAGSPQAVCAVRHGEGATTACAAEPRVKIRYVADDRGGESSQKNSVEVYIDDVLVHEQALPQERDLSGSEFKAVLSTPTGLPVVLNFARNGEDGKPTVYITEGRSPALESGGLQPADGAYGASLKEVHAAVAEASSGATTFVAGDANPQESSSCCFASTCGPRRSAAGTGRRVERGGAPVDILVSPAYPLASDTGNRCGVEIQEVEPPGDACIFGQYLKHCFAAPPPRIPQQPAWEQMQLPRSPAPQVYTVPRIRAYTGRAGVQR